MRWGRLTYRRSEAAGDSCVKDLLLGRSYPRALEVCP